MLRLVNNVKGVAICLAGGGGLTAYKVIENIDDFDQCASAADEMLSQNLGEFVGFLSEEDLKKLFEAVRQKQD